MADVLLACAPHSVDTPHKGRVRRAKLDFNVLNEAKVKVRKLAEKAGIDFKFKKSGYPHFYYIDDQTKDDGPCCVRVERRQSVGRCWITRFLPIYLF